MPECCQPLQLTKESLDHFTAHMANGPTDPLVVELQSHLATHWSYQKLCLKYLVGSVAVFGKADEYSLKTILESCSRKEMCLSYLLNKLRQRNNADTVAHLIAGLIGYEPFTSCIRQLVAKLMKKNWKAMQQLAMRSLDVVKNAGQHCKYYGFLVRHLPAELKYEMIRTREIGPEEMGKLCGGEVDRELRQIFLLARCSRDPDPEIRASIADKFPFFKQCLAEDRVGSRVESPCPGRIPELTDDALSHISRFMDIETVVCVMPAVCKAWRNLHSSIVLDNRRVMNLYLLDLNYVKLDEIHAKMPWKRHLGDETNVLKYFGQCIEDGGLDRIKPTSYRRGNLMKYLEAVAEGRAGFPRIEDSVTQHDAFVKLFGKIHRHCHGFGTLELYKPSFFTDEEYELTVYHFVYEKRLILHLSESLIVDDMPRLFGIIKDDEKLMRQLVRSNFYSHMDASFALILCGRTRKIPDKLARLIFGQTKWLKGLVEPKVVDCSEYYRYMVESGILAQRIAHCDKIGKMLPRLLTSIILCFKNMPEIIDRLVRSIAEEFRHPGSRMLQDVKQELETPFGSLTATEGYSTEDLEFFKGVMMRCGLM